MARPSRQVAFSQIGLNVRARRLTLGLKQKEVAVRADLSEQHVSFIETGRRKDIEPATVSKLAQALECTADALLAGAKPANGSATEKVLEEFIRQRKLSKIEADAMREVRQVLGSRPDEAVLFRLLDLVREKLRAR